MNARKDLPDATLKSIPMPNPERPVERQPIIRREFGLVKPFCSLFAAPPLRRRRFLGCAPLPDRNGPPGGHIASRKTRLFMDMPKLEPKSARDA